LRPDAGHPVDAAAPPPPAPAAPSDAGDAGAQCIYGDGLYCGGNGVRGKDTTLYRCTGGVRSVEHACDTECLKEPPHVDDHCAL
jgi:hypothetical protein